MQHKAKRNRVDVRRRIAVWVASFALSLQVLMPLGQAVPYPSAAGENSYLIICTAFGIKQLPNPDVPPKPDNRPVCPICMAHAFGATMMLSAVVAVEPPQIPARTVSVRPSDERWGGRAPLSLSSRDPPIA